MTSIRNNQGSCGGACAYRMFTIVLVIFICLDAITAAPVPEESTPKPQKPKNSTRHPRKKIQQKGNGKKSLEHRNPFNDESVNLWQNACDSVDFVESNKNDNTKKQSLNDSISNLKLSFKTVNSSIAGMDKINTTGYETWEHFNNDRYSFLPMKPGGQAHKWHEHLQIYVASFSLLYKRQHKVDFKADSFAVSEELKKILTDARALLCDIEHFVNATSNKNGKNKPYWFNKTEMAKIVTIRRDKSYINNVFVKGRLENYLDRLYRRIQNYNPEKNLETKSLRYRPESLKVNKNRVNQRKRRTTTTRNSFSSTEKTFIVKMKGPRKNSKNRNNSNKINQ